MAALSKVIEMYIRHY